MSAVERIEAAIALRQGKPIPVAPLIISFAGRCAGMTQADIFSSLHKWQIALEATFARVGTPDAIFPLWPRDAAKSQMLRLLLPGEELDADAQFQYSESEVMRRDDYDVHHPQGIPGMVHAVSPQNTHRHFSRLAWTHFNHSGFHAAGDAHQTQCQLLEEENGTACHVLRSMLPCI